MPVLGTAVSPSLGAALQPRAASSLGFPVGMGGSPILGESPLPLKLADSLQQGTWFRMGMSCAAIQVGDGAPQDPPIGV